MASGASGASAAGQVTKIEVPVFTRTATAQQSRTAKDPARVSNENGLSLDVLREGR